MSGPSLTRAVRAELPRETARGGRALRRAPDRARPAASNRIPHDERTARARRLRRVPRFLRPEIPRQSRLPTPAPARNQRRTVPDAGEPLERSPGQAVPPIPREVRLVRAVQESFRREAPGRVPRAFQRRILLG